MKSNTPFERDTLKRAYKQSLLYIRTHTEARTPVSGTKGVLARAGKRRLYVELKGESEKCYARAEDRHARRASRSLVSPPENRQSIARRGTAFASRAVLSPVAETVSACRSRATRPARPDTAVDNLGQSPLPVKRLHEALQSAQVKRQRLSPPYPAPPAPLHPIHQLAVHQHIKVQQSIVQQSIVQQHQLNLAHQSLQNLQAQSLQAAQQSLQAAQNLQAAQGLQAAQSPAATGGAGTQQAAGATQGALVPPQQPSPRAASPQHKNMELALCQSMDSVNTATTEEEVSWLNLI
ncbi:unnamed protein product [Euphydryas editha]|uniref:Uncharacterized protein n=1 Tax=Euphydryas editha TaxID=104508 RepID=A0AAU9TC86_EUPED|nr:unnamed protein product [Euphydryas editha]